MFPGPVPAACPGPTAFPSRGPWGEPGRARPAVPRGSVCHSPQKMAAPRRGSPLSDPPQAEHRPPRHRPVPVARGRAAVVPGAAAMAGARLPSGGGAAPGGGTRGAGPGRGGRAAVGRALPGGQRPCPRGSRRPFPAQRSSGGRAASADRRCRSRRWRLTRLTCAALGTGSYGDT